MDSTTATTTATTTTGTETPWTSRLIERLWAKVDVRGPGECWPWTASLNNGYGQVGVIVAPGVQRIRRAPRLIFELTYGTLPPSVRHTCDNPVCCNPAHLVGGTQRDNSDHMYERERQASRLTLESVRAIRERYHAGERSRALADEYGVSISTVQMAVRGDTWDRVEHPEPVFGPGLCECGCGQKTSIAKMTNSAKGHVKGQPTHFIKGHSRRVR
jgi:hypothetical protein